MAKMAPSSMELAWGRMAHSHSVEGQAYCSGLHVADPAQRGCSPVCLGRQLGVGIANQERV